GLGKSSAETSRREVGVRPVRSGIAGSGASKSKNSALRPFWSRATLAPATGLLDSSTTVPRTVVGGSGTTLTVRLALALWPTVSIAVTLKVRLVTPRGTWKGWENGLVGAGDRAR